ncbi:MAG: hypothetical protein ACLVJC_01175 [Dorea formicigenerans]
MLSFRNYRSQRDHRPWTGFHNVADKKLNVVASQTGDFNRSDGMSVMENMLQADSGIQGVFAHNDEMALVL